MALDPAADPRIWPRAVMHVDMECFFVAVEVLDDPSLAGRPVIVGGTGRRGVVAAASYEARAYGVSSAMPMSTARSRCPQAVAIPGRMHRYSEVSTALMSLFRDVTPLVEPLSVDEAFLDVTGCQRQRGGARAIAKELRAEVRSRLGLSCSVGVASGKSVAKLASEAAKPTPSRRGPIPGRGVVIVYPGRESEFLDPLPVRALFGVGAVTASKLERNGWKTVADLRADDAVRVERVLGARLGRHVWDMARGHDDRPVVPDQSTKSISNEVTFPEDIYDRDALDEVLVGLVDGVAWRVRKANLRGRTLTLKVRFGDFTTVSRSHTFERPEASEAAMLAAARTRLRDLDVETGIRLLGVGMTQLQEPGPTQMSLDDAPSADELSETIDAIRDRFGRTSLGPARLAGRVHRTQQWGPDERSPG